MSIKKNIKIQDSDLIKLKRQARIYKIFFIRIINVITVFGLFLLLYFYRRQVAKFLSDVKASYISLYEETSRISEVFNNFFNQHIESVEINGLKNIDKQEIISAMYTLNEDGYVSIKNSVREIHDQILKINIVDSVLIRRILWQHKIIITVKEKNIIMVVKNKLDNKRFLLDENGVVIDNAGLIDKFNSFPIIENSDNPDKILPMYQHLKEKDIIDKIYGFSMVSDRRWNIRFKNNLIVKLPAKEWKDAIDIMLHIDERINLLAKDNVMSYIDLRIPGKIFLK